MGLLVGTDDGLFRADGPGFNPQNATRALRGETVRCLYPSDHGDDVFAATFEGVYRSTNGGRTWEDLGAPIGDANAWSVLETQNGLYVGTDGPALLRSTDGGERWEELTGIHELPSRSIWGSPVTPDRGRIRALAVDPSDPDRVVMGIEAGGIHTSDDGGETWTDHREDSPDDVHQLTPIGPGEYLIATGHLDWDLETEEEHALGDGGVHRSTDSGGSWTRLERGNEYSYVRGLLYHDDRLYFAGSTTHPGQWHDHGGTDAALFESSDLGETLERVDYPGAPTEIVEAWTVIDGDVIGGTGAYSSNPPEEIRGRIARRRPDGRYETTTRIPTHVTCIESL